MGGLLSFLGGTAFRWLFGEIFGVVKAREERRQEIEQMRLQLEQDQMRHQWQMEAISAQAAAGVKVIEAQSQAALDAAAATAFGSAVEGANAAAQRADWIGAWNASIRPALATVSILLLVGQAVAPAAVVLNPLVTELVCAVLGVFVGERIRARGA